MVQLFRLAEFVVRSPRHRTKAPTLNLLFVSWLEMSGTRRDREGGPVRATVRNVEESEQLKPTASKVVKSTERRRGKSPGSKSTRTRSVFNFYLAFCLSFVLSTMNDVTRPKNTRLPS